jgi:enoyl-CoA hydratase/carnithine racemase
MGEFIKTERDGHLFILTLDRPQVLNSLHAPACFEMSAALDEFVADPDLWVGIITGEGRAFCAGHDLVAAPDEEMPPTGWAGISDRQDIDKPLIAAINGAAMGGGLEIALACDIIVAAQSAKLGMTEAKWNAVALGGGIQRLQLRVPRNIANAMLLAAKVLTADEGARWGLVNEVVPDGEALAAARRWANEILTCAPLAVRYHKKLASQFLEDESFTRKVQNSRKPVLDVIFNSEDIKEGIAAFKERRKPNWKGR